MGGFKCLMTMMVLLFCFIGWSSNGWFTIWLMMELVLIMFMGYMACSCGYKVGELMIKYFVTQVFVSLFLSFLFIAFFFCNLGFVSQISMFVLMSKLGMFPFHGWMLNILGKVEWWGYYLMSTFLKLIPILFIYYSTDSQNVWFMVVTGGAFGGVLGLNNLVIQKLFGYSSMVHLSWILVGSLVGGVVFWCYIFSYMLMMCYIVKFCSMLGSYYVNHLKLNSSIFFVKLGFVFMLLSLAGFPPFLGFLLKWIIVVGGCESSGPMVLILLGGSAVSLFFYLQLVYYFIMIYSLNVKWNKTNFLVDGSGFFMFFFSIMLVWFILF